MPGSNGLFAQMKPNGAHWYKSNNIFPFGGNITAVGRKRYIWIILLSIYRGGMWFGITTLDCLAYQYLGWWPTAVPAMAPTGRLHSRRRGGGPPIGPRAPRTMYGGVHVPLASNHSKCCQRVLLPISILDRKLSGSAELAIVTFISALVQRWVVPCYIG